MCLVPEQVQKMLRVGRTISLHFSRLHLTKSRTVLSRSRVSVLRVTQQSAVSMPVRMGKKDYL